VKCAPPDNKPEPAERDACAPWLAAELALIRPVLRVVVCLGHFAWQAVWPQLSDAGYAVPRPRPTFGHAAEVSVLADSGTAALTVLGCYHPSQQNTFTGKLTEPMFDAVFTRANRLIADAQAS
jgi:uracil-DNA glycosylase family 4